MVKVPKGNVEDDHINLKLTSSVASSQVRRSILVSTLRGKYGVVSKDEFI